MSATRKIASFLWWTYPRGSLEYDLMVGLILAFIFFTPRHAFRDQPRPAAAAAGPAATAHAATLPPRRSGEGGARPPAVAP